MSAGTLHAEALLVGPGLLRKVSGPLFEKSPKHLLDLALFQGNLLRGSQHPFPFLLHLSGNDYFLISGDSLARELNKLQALFCISVCPPISYLKGSVD